MPAILKKDVSIDSVDGAIDSSGSTTSLEPPLIQIKNLIEKKIRNLEKRKTKLDQYKADLKGGKTLTGEQTKAIERICDVEQQIELTKELQKNINQIVQESNRQQKVFKQKEYKEKCETDLSKIRQLLAMQEILHTMNQDTVRHEFRSGINGAIKLTEDEFAILDYVYKKICPIREHTAENIQSTWAVYLQDSAQFAYSLLNCSSKSTPDKELTYKDVRSLIDKISTCEYFHNKISRCHSPEQAKSDSSSIHGECSNDDGASNPELSPSRKASKDIPQNELNLVAVANALSTKPEETCTPQQQPSSPYCNQNFSNDNFCPYGTLGFVAPQDPSMAAFVGGGNPALPVVSGAEILNANPIAFCNTGQESLAFVYAQRQPFVTIPAFVDNFAHAYPTVTSMENACQLSPVGHQPFMSTGYTSSKPLDPNAPSFISRAPVNWIPVMWPNHTFPQEISSEEANQTFDALQEIVDIGTTDPTTEESNLTVTSGSVDETDSVATTNDVQQCYEEELGGQSVETLIADFNEMSVHPELELLNGQAMQPFCPQMPPTAPFQPNYHTVPPSLWYAYGLQTFGPPCI